VRYLLIAAAAHVALTTTIFFIGHFQLLPNTFDPNGIGLTFALDGATYQKLAGTLAEELHTQGFRAWLELSAPFHARLYSLGFATFGKILGYNILAAEPLNLIYYLGILSCIYCLGREAFNARAGLLAALIIALWPSFLIHSTQLMRDSLALLCFLAMMVVLVLLVSRELALRQAISIAFGGALCVTLFWMTRGNMWNLVLVAIATTLAMLAYRMIRQKKLMTGNALVLLVILIAALLVPARLESTTLPGVRPPASPFAIPSAATPAPNMSIWTRVIRQIAHRRAGFQSSTARASDIDSDVRFNGVGDMLRFLPRAAVIGFFAPFPNMWLQTGTTGNASRLVSGAETLAMYFLYIPAAFCIWRERRNLKLWLLFLVAAVGLIALGLVVVNAGALFRIRYVFWMLLIVIAAEGIRHLTVLRTRVTKS
jgi:putative peptidoglycan lipid II flippase